MCCWRSFHVYKYGLNRPSFNCFFSPSKPSSALCPSPSPISNIGLPTTTSHQITLETYIALIDLPSTSNFDPTPPKPTTSTITMTYNARRCETLQRLGIEQLPTLYSDRQNHKAEYVDANEMISPLGGNLPVRTMPVSVYPHDDLFQRYSPN
jgi:hypothetical protein